MSNDDSQTKIEVIKGRVPQWCYEAASRAKPCERDEYTLWITADVIWSVAEREFKKQDETWKITYDDVASEADAANDLLIERGNEIASLRSKLAAMERALARVEQYENLYDAPQHASPRAAGHWQEIRELIREARR